MLRSAAICAFSLPGVAWALDTPAAAPDGGSAPNTEPPGPHRISGSIGYAAADGNKDVEGDHQVAEHAGSFRAGYAYRLVNGFELGADVSYWTSEGRGINAFIPSANFRPFLSIRDVVEVGLTGRVGLLIWPQSGAGTGAWTGLSLSAGPDVRVWLTRAVGVQVAGDVTLASGTGPSIPNLVNERASFMAAGMFAGVLYRL